MEHTGRAPIPFYMVMTALIAATGGLLFGYDTGIISGALLHIEQSFTVGTWTKELIVSAVVIGALLGALLSGRLVDRYGSQRMLRYMAVTFIIGTVLSCLAQSVATLIAGRLLIGVAIGVTSYLSPLFISEMAPAHVRGALVLLNGVMITSGESFAFLTDYFLEPTQSWRLMFATGLVPALILFFGTLLLPPSPRWLALKGRMAEAKQTLEKIRGGAAVSAELQEICSHLHHGHANLRDCLSPTVRPALMIGVTLGVLQQFVGINTVMYYGPTIFAAVGYAASSDQLLSTFILGVINTIVTLISILLVERVGRRRMLLTGLALSGMALFMLGSLMSATITYPVLSLLLLVFYIAGYSMSIGSLFWLIISEIFPLNVRGTGMSAATAAQWAGNIVVTMTFLSLLNTLGSQRVFWLYGAMCGLGAVFCYFFVPETQGVPLEQIERNLRTGKSIRQLGEPLTSSVKG